MAPHFSAFLLRTCYVCPSGSALVHLGTQTATLFVSFLYLVFFHTLTGSPSLKKFHILRTGPNNHFHCFSRHIGRLLWPAHLHANWHRGKWLLRHTKLFTIVQSRRAQGVWHLDISNMNESCCTVSIGVLMETEEDGHPTIIANEGLRHNESWVGLLDTCVVH